MLINCSYDVERMANGLCRVKPLINWDEPIAEGYFPKLTTNNGAMHWASRPANMFLQAFLILKNNNFKQIKFIVQFEF